VTRPRIVLVGCSFAGLEFLYRYVRRRGGRLAPGELTVVEPRSQHPYVPLAHEAASGASAPESLRFDVEALCVSVGAGVVRGRATAIDPRARIVSVDGSAPLPYDRLVVAVGSEPAIPAAFAARGVVPAKWLSDALELRDRIAVVHATTRAPVRLTIIGAGITGVEWAAELATSRIAGIRPVVTVVEREARLLVDFAPGVADRASRVLRELGVPCILGRPVSEIASDAVVLDGGERIPTDIPIWGGGVRPNAVVKDLGLPLTPDGHVVVTSRLAVPGVDGVYAIGDVARVHEDGSQWPTMERAIEAIWQGATLARRLAGSWGDDDGPTHRLRREFFYGLSLGTGHSLLVYRAFWLDARLFVHFRRWLKWAYYARFTLLARWGAARTRRSAPV
jgi:NADH dehydrogenase